MTTRRSLSPMRRLAIFEKVGGLCSLCGQKIFGKDWDVEHRIPLALGGADDESNWAPAHRACHATKTAADLGSVAKAKRCKARHIGIKKGRGFYRPANVKWDWKRQCYTRQT